MTEKKYELVIIGAGPSGLTASIYAKRAELDFVVLERGIPGGQIATAGMVENYPGFPDGIRGMEIAENMRKQAENIGVKIENFSEVNSIEKVEESNGEFFRIKTPEKEYLAKAIIIATGLEHKKLGIRGEKEFAGKGVSYCATCDGALYKGKKVAVIGGGTAAAMAALNLSDIVKEVILITKQSKPKVAEKIIERRLFSRGNIKIIGNAKIKEIFGMHVVEGILIERNGEEERIEVSGVFVEVGKKPNTKFLNSLGVKMEHGYIVVDAYQRTNIPGVFACGDVTNIKVKQLAVACSQGAIAALSAYEYIKGKEI